MGRRSRKSKRRLNSLFLTLLLTAVLLIMSTYAWFTTNKAVEIQDITAKVVAAEGLQISIDGETWGASVSVTGQTLNTAGQTVGTSGTNLSWPNELEPVSTIGQFSGTDMVFKYGLLAANGADLTGINTAPLATTANTTGTDPTYYSDGKYIAFDVYLKNSSSNPDGDTLQLNTGSNVLINSTNGVAGTGLENSVRVGFALYEDASGAQTSTATAAFTATKPDVFALTGTPKLCIWEPNYNDHISEIVTNDSRITAQTTDYTTLGLTSEATGDVTGIVTSTSPVASPTDSTVKFSNTQTTLKTVKSTTGLSAPTALVDSSNSNFTLKQNRIMKMRVYIWLEGQDPDCLDTASTGKQFDVIIKLCKPSSNG